MTITPDSQAMDLFRRHGGLLRTGEILKAGVHPRTLYRLRDTGQIVQVTRGVYRIADSDGLAHPDLVAVALRVPRGVLCLVSALAYHDATTEIPHEVQIALPRRSNKPQLDFPPLRVFWFSGPALTEGVEVVQVDGIDLQVYSLPKTVVDCFRFRNKLGLDVAIEGLSKAVREKGVRPTEILHFARLCRIETVILPYVEAIQ